MKFRVKVDAAQRKRNANKSFILNWFLIFFCFLIIWFYAMFSNNETKFFDFLSNLYIIVFLPGKEKQTNDIFWSEGTGQRMSVFFPFRLPISYPYLAFCCWTDWFSWKLYFEFKWIESMRGEHWDLQDFVDGSFALTKQISTWWISSLFFI